MIFSELWGKLGQKCRISPVIFGFLALSAANAARTVFLVLLSTSFWHQMSP